jgi:opacity protein-like surface antigen
MKLSRGLVLAALALVSGTAAAADDRGFYVGFGAGMALADVDENEFDGLLVDVAESAGLSVVDGTSKVSDSDASLGLLVGYRFLPWLAVEAEWLTLGKVDYEAHVQVTDGVVVAPLKTTIETDAKGVAVSALGIWPISQQWDLYGRVGVLLADTSASVRFSSEGASETVSDSQSTQVVLAGIGAGWKVSPTWTVRFDYQRFLDVGDDDLLGEASIDRLSVQWLYKF